MEPFLCFTAHFYFFLPRTSLTKLCLLYYFDSQRIQWKYTKIQWHCSSKGNKDILISVTTKCSDGRHTDVLESTGCFIINQEIVCKKFKLSLKKCFLDNFQCALPVQFFLKAEKQTPRFTTFFGGITKPGKFGYFLVSLFLYQWQMWSALYH